MPDLPLDYMAIGLFMMGSDYKTPIPHCMRNFAPNTVWIALKINRVRNAPSRGVGELGVPVSAGGISGFERALHLEERTKSNRLKR